MPAELIRQLADKLQMTPDQVLEQAVSFAYANARMENPDITIEMIWAAMNVRS